MAENDPEFEAIAATVADYVDSWFDADAGRMEQSIHPELNHRFVRLLPSGVEFLDETGASKLIHWTASGVGQGTPPSHRRRHHVTILDRYFRAAAARAITPNGVEHLQLGKFGERWRIVNVLGQSRVASPFKHPLVTTRSAAAIGNAGGEPATASAESVARDYLEGWCGGDVERVTRAAHPQWSKKGVRHSTPGGFFLEYFGAQKFVRWVGSVEHSRQLIAPPMVYTLLDQADDIAMVKIAWNYTPAGEFPGSVDYVDLARIDNRWQVINVLWEPDRSTGDGDVLDQDWASWHW